MMNAPIRGAMPGEITLAELMALWGFGRTRTWELVVRQQVIPHRRDRHRIYVKLSDAQAYNHEVLRGRPPQ